jgi:Rho GDP-dissociation inhibitor
MASQGEDDLQASKTEGFKVGEKKTVEEYAKLGELHEASKHHVCEH